MALILKVNTQIIRENILKIKEKIGDTKFCAVVKANAYGVGIDLVKYIDDCVNYYAVSCVSEANQLSSLTKKQIIVLSPPSIDEIMQINSSQIEFAVDDIGVVKKLTKINKDFYVHIAVNTGMNRFGVNEKVLIDICKEIKSANNIFVKGIFSHFWGEDEISHDGQSKLFNNCCRLLKRFFPNAICHISNTSGIFYHYDMVRVGIGLYERDDYKCLKLISKVSKIQSLSKGDSAGYGAKFVAKRKTKIAAVKVGYGDGITRNMVGYNVLINGKLCKIVAVCMDAILVDASHANVHNNDEVIICTFNKKELSICNLAKHCDTISYEILTRLTSRVTRIYER